MADNVFVTTAGLGMITNRMKGAGTEPLYMHWGTGAGTAATTDTALTTPATEARATSTSTREQTIYANDTYQSQCTLVAGTSKAVTEVSLHDHASTGDMYLHGTFTAIPLNASDSIQFTVKTQFIST